MWTEYEQPKKPPVVQKQRRARDGSLLKGLTCLSLRSESSTIIAFLSFTGTSEDWALAEVGHDRGLRGDEGGD